MQVWPAIVLGVLIALSILRRFAQLVTVEGHSDRLFVRRTRQCRVNDVVVFISPVEIPDGPGLLVKRVAAISGDPVPEAVRRRVADTVVPVGQLVVLGDNARSLDSRRLGFIAAEAVLGVVIRRHR